MNEKYFIYGANGFGREVVDLLRDVKGFVESELIEKVVLIDDNPDLKNISGLNVIHSSEYSPNDGPVVIAIADPLIRKQIVSRLPKETTFYSLIHPSAIIGRNTVIGEGTVICAGAVITCNVTIGSHCHLNFGTAVAHDCVIGNYFTAAPSVSINGNISVGEGVYCGTKSVIMQGLKIADNVVVGMSSAVFKSVKENGVTVLGNPARILFKPDK